MKTLWQLALERVSPEVKDLGEDLLVFREKIRTKGLRRVVRNLVEYNLTPEAERPAWIEAKNERDGEPRA